MFETGNTESGLVATQRRRRARKNGERGVRKLYLFSSLFSVVAFLVCGVFLLMRSKDSLDDYLVRMEEDASKVLYELSASTQNSVLPVLANGKRVIKTWRKDLKRFTKMEMTQADRIIRLYKLDDMLNRWDSIIEGEKAADISPLEERWEVVFYEIRVEKKKWPIYTSRVRYGIPRFFRPLWDGAIAGIGWPYYMALRGLEVQRSVTEKGTFVFPLYVRYLLFPHKLRDISVPWVFGFGFCSTLSGYGLCWLGMKRGGGVISFLGIVYLFYTGLFAMLLCFLVGGLIS